jgi:hypothetical protein
VSLEVWFEFKNKAMYVLVEENFEASIHPSGRLSDLSYGGV